VIPVTGRGKIFSSANDLWKEEQAGPVALRE